MKKIIGWILTAIGLLFTITAGIEVFIDQDVYFTLCVFFMVGLLPLVIGLKLIEKLKLNKMASIFAVLFCIVGFTVCAILAPPVHPPKNMVTTKAKKDEPVQVEETPTRKDLNLVLGQSDYTEDRLKFGAYVYARAYIEVNLKAPSTAKFLDYNPKLVDMFDDSTFHVDGYVDSQNSFGAMLRMRYDATIKWLGGELKDPANWKSIRLNTNDGQQ